MSSHQWCAIAAIFLAVSASRPVSAQVVEVGLDGGLEIQGNGTDADVVSVSLPVSSVRAGLHLTRRFSLEAAVGASHVDFVNPGPTPSVSSLDLSVAGLYHFGASPTSARAHLLLGVPFRYARLSDDAGTVSDSDYGMVVGAGMTVPAGERFAGRLQARGVGWKGSRTRLSILLGISFFTG